MRLRTFTAPTVIEAMNMVRQHLGPDAVIISTEPSPDGGSTVTAAIEDGFDDSADIGWQADPLEAIAEALDGHGVPPGLAQRLGSAALDGIDDDPAVALASALAVHFRFAPIDLPRGQRLALVGPSGAGKTVTIAKLATRQVLTRRPLRVVSTDTNRAGAVEQLAALTRVLSLPLACADAAGALIRQVKAAGTDPVLIDTPGFNPYRDAERRDIMSLVAAARAEPVLVLPAGLDAGEAVEIVASCAELGCRRLIATRLDAARRLGSLLAAADAGHLAFAEVGVTPDIADGLCPLSPLGLARLLLPDRERDTTLSEIFDRGALS
jgi:flagellar biosynthesis protein FlhF